MQFSIRVKGEKEVAAFFRALKGNAAAALVKGFRQAAIIVQRRAKENVQKLFYSAGRPWKKTGHLGRKIEYDVKEGTFGVVARVGTNLLYARIQEEGGKIVPKNRPFLAWRDIYGKWYFARMVKIPARPYMKPALWDSEDEVRQAVFDAIRDLARKGK